jgi:hypothetical protein
MAHPIGQRNYIHRVNVMDIIKLTDVLTAAANNISNIQLDDDCCGTLRVPVDPDETWKILVNTDHDTGKTIITIRQRS